MKWGIELDVQGGCVVGVMTVDWLEEGRFLLWEVVGRVEGFGLMMES